MRRVEEITEAEQKKNLKNEDSLRDHWENIMCNNIPIIGVPEGEEREKGAEHVFEETMAKKISCGLE